MKNQTYTLIIIVFIILLIVPYFIFKDKVVFAPDIFLTEWYKTLFISGVLGTLYHFYFKEKIQHLLQINTINREIDELIEKITELKLIFENDKQKSMTLISEMRKSSYHLLSNKEISKIKDKITILHQKKGNHFNKNEMIEQIKFSLNSILHKLK